MPSSYVCNWAGNMAHRYLKVLDDDMAISTVDLANGFEAWRQFGRRQRLVGFFSRAAKRAADGHTYVYDWAVGRDYNMVLTGAAFVDQAFFRAYWAPAAAPIRQIVEEYANVRWHPLVRAKRGLIAVQCEDIGINAVVGASPSSRSACSSDQVT